MTASSTRSHHLKVHTISRSARRGILTLGPMQVPCALGRNGSRWRKREGDLATPSGRWSLLQARWRPDRVRRWELVPTGLPGRPMRPHDGWCDDPRDRNYNRPVCVPYDASAEDLWRAQNVYDLIIILSHNERPRVRGAGSAVFMHVAEQGRDGRSDLEPTAGCIALRKRDWARIAPYLRYGARLFIKG